MWLNIADIYKKYSGTGLVFIWFLAALIYLFLREKDKPRRILFVYVPIIILFLYFNPLFAKFFYTFLDNQIYFRLFWLIPVVPAIAYATIGIVDELKGKKRVLFAVASLCMMMISGKLVYTNPLFTAAENIYHVPDSVVDVCEAIIVPGREVKAALPVEMLLYTRQYTPMVHMPYGRNAFDGDENEFFTLMEADVIDLEKLVVHLNRTGCHYLVLSEQKEIPSSPRDYGLEEFKKVDGYRIFRNTNIILETDF